MLSALSHIATVLHTPSKTYCKTFEKIMIDFIKGEKKLTETDDTVKARSSILSQDAIFSPKTNNGFGLRRVLTF